MLAYSSPGSALEWTVDVCVTPSPTVGQRRSLYFTSDVFALTDQAAFIRARRVTARFVGSVFQQQVVAFAAVGKIQAQRPSRQNFRALSEMRSRQRHAAFGDALLHVFRKFLAGQQLVPCCIAAVFHSESSFHGVDRPQEADRHTVPRLVRIGRLVLGVLSKLWHRRGQRQSKEYRTTESNSCSHRIPPFRKTPTRTYYFY